MLSAAGLGGKKLLASADPFSALEVASFSVPPDEYFRVGMHAFPPSPAGDDRYLCAVQMSGSSAFSSQSHQCCLLVYWRVLSYKVLAALNCLCIGCNGWCFSL